MGKFNLTGDNKQKKLKPVKARRDFSTIPESEVVVDYVYNRYKKGHYSTLYIIGLPNTGKSSTCQRLAELISKKINKENENK